MIGANRSAFGGSFGTYPPRAIAYRYTAWDPTDVAGSATNGASTAASTLAAPAYISMANSSGTLTLTFIQPGNYLITVTGHNEGAEAIATELSMDVTVGGTATRYMGPTVVRLFYAAALTEANLDGSFSFMVSATASQTLTILPSVSVTDAGGATTSYTTNCAVTATYTGT